MIPHGTRCECTTTRALPMSMRKPSSEHEPHETWISRVGKNDWCQLWLTHGDSAKSNGGFWANYDGREERGGNATAMLLAGARRTRVNKLARSGSNSWRQLTAVAPLLPYSPANMRRANLSDYVGLFTILTSFVSTRCHFSNCSDTRGKVQFEVEEERAPNEIRSFFSLSSFAYHVCFAYLPTSTCAKCAALIYFGCVTTSLNENKGTTRKLSDILFKMIIINIACLRSLSTKFNFLQLETRQPMYYICCSASCNIITKLRYLQILQTNIPKVNVAGLALDNYNGFVDLV